MCESHSPPGQTPMEPCAIGEKVRIAAELRKRHVYLRLIPSRLENTIRSPEPVEGGRDAPAWFDKLTTVSENEDHPGIAMSDGKDKASTDTRAPDRPGASATAPSKV